MARDTGASLLSDRCVNRRLPDIDAKLEKFAMDPGYAPKRIGDTHPSNKLSNL
jgi:hypothetical protein